MKTLTYISANLLVMLSISIAEDTKHTITVKDLKRGDFIKLQRPSSTIYYGAFLSVSPNSKNRYDMSTGKMLENPNWDRDQAGNKLPENELWYIITSLSDHDAISNRRTFEVFKNTGEYKYMKFVLQAKDIVEKYKPSSVFEAYAAKELRKPDTLVEDWIAHPEKYVTPSGR
jgi:hypothetical protein